MKTRKHTLLPLATLCGLALIGNASAGLVVNLSAGSGTDTTIDGATVTTWVAAGDTASTTFTRSGSDARYVADSGGGIAAIDFDRSAPFLGNITSAMGGSPTITNATILVWANFDGYSHGASSSSYYFSINGSGNEHTLGRDGNGGTDYIYHYDGGGQATGTLQPQPAGWNLYIARFYGTPAATISAEAWIDSVGDGAVITGAADLTNSDNTGYNGNADSVRIGTWTSGGSGLDGQIRGLRIYDDILDDTEIQQAAQSNDRCARAIINHASRIGYFSHPKTQTIERGREAASRIQTAASLAPYMSYSRDGAPVLLCHWFPRVLEPPFHREVRNSTPVRYGSMLLQVGNALPGSFVVHSQPIHESNPRPAGVWRHHDEKANCYQGGETNRYGKIS